MGERSSIARLCAFAVAGVLLGASCGGSDGGSEATGEPGQAGVVLDTAVEVESAVVETTTPDTTSPDTAAPQPTTPAETTPVATPVATEPDVTTAPTAPPDTAPPATEPVSTGVPVGYRPVFDDSGDLRANVPAEWIQTDGAPNGDARQLVAAADLPGFLAGYTLPGMLLVAGDAAVPDAWVDGLAGARAVAESDGCTVSDTLEYDDGVYTGTEHLLSCGSTATSAHLIGGRDAEGELFFLLAIVRPIDAVDVRDQIVQSFFVN